METLQPRGSFGKERGDKFSRIFRARASESSAGEDAAVVVVIIIGSCPESRDYVE